VTGALAQPAKPAPDLKSIVGKWSGTGQSALGNYKKTEIVAFSSTTPCSNGTTAEAAPS
jgi:hypothetical protein